MSKPQGALVLVTSVNPTPFGEGNGNDHWINASLEPNRETSHMCHSCEPSMGPVFGIKGGAAGGGHSQVLPMEDINLHLPVIYTLLPLHTIYYQLWLTTISNMVMSNNSTLHASYGQEWSTTMTEHCAISQSGLVVLKWIGQRRSIRHHRCQRSNGDLGSRLDYKDLRTKTWKYCSWSAYGW